ncbi:trp operon leader peptide [Salmonella enterica subsp. enterica serovar Saintpaul]|nr:trp operon leader peptide [Salmonella enterica subsp. enterica serovar Saintpaul]EDS2908428.1 trp operon leader peptide [Salmonella enterica]ELX5345093.1 trp operon leader peptide [Salmonella enterica]
MAATFALHAWWRTS